MFDWQQASGAQAAAYQAMLNNAQRITPEQAEAMIRAQANASHGINRGPFSFWGAPSSPQPRSRFDSPDVIDLVADSHGVFRVPAQLEHKVRER